MILNYRLLRDCFAESYDEGRRKFLEACDNAGVRVDSRVNPHGLTTEEKPLSCDVAWFGPDSATHLCMAICGTHGLEAASGSATMIQWILEKQYQHLPKDTAVLFVHANNPYGWARNSRTNENNVDLNRNFFDHQDHPDNAHYMAQHPILLTEKMTEGDCATIGEKLAAYEQQHGKVAGLASIVQGQYQQPDGLMFGGTEAEWSMTNLRNIIETYVSTVKKVAVIDWHTGLGPFGEPFLICHHPKNSAAYWRACALWGKERIEEGGAFQNPDVAPEFKGIIIHGLSALPCRAAVRSLMWSAAGPCYCALNRCLDN
jgi:hypothetical protein